MRRREFIAGLGGAVAWPTVARAQQAGVPVVGWMGLAPLDINNFQIPAVRRGLAEAGFVAGENLIFEYHSVDFQLDRLPMVARELVDRRVSVLAAIMHHASLFCTPGWRTRAVDPSVWVGVRELAVQSVWG
jgi:putative tryptophan/tyrosine transport system substrate-binding protein